MQRIQVLSTAEKEERCSVSYALHVAHHEADRLSFTRAGSGDIGEADAPVHCAKVPAHVRYFVEDNEV